MNTYNIIEKNVTASKEISVNTDISVYDNPSANANTTAPKNTAHYHLPGLFEFLEFYKVFLPLFYEHREYFYEWCDIGSIYGAPADCLWGGGRVGFGDDCAEEVLELLQRYPISARLTFSNSLLRPEHLADRKCNELCALFEKHSGTANGIILHSDLLLDYLREKYPGFCFISSTTKVITGVPELLQELNREEFRYVVPDFRLNHRFELWDTLSDAQKDKVEFLCNECCWFGCRDRKTCYEEVSRKSLGEDDPEQSEDSLRGHADESFSNRYPGNRFPEHICRAPGAAEGYKFSRAMKNPGFIGIHEIEHRYLPGGFSNFKIEGRSLGSALLLEFLLYYMTKPEYQLTVREEIYLDSSLDLF